MERKKSSLILKVFLFTLLISVFIFCAMFLKRSREFKFTPFINFSEQTIVPKGYAIFTPGCKIQDFEPYDRSVIKFLDKPYPIYCFKKNWKPLAVVNQSYTISIDFSQLWFYGGSLNYCLYTPIFRTEDGFSDNGFKYGQSEPFYDVIYVKHEFVNIKCYNMYRKIYEDFFPFVFRKPHVQKRCLRIKDSYQDYRKRLSVTILGVDSVSRINFMRFCPKTRKYLLKEMDAIEMKGYNKVGDNTFHNLVPMLSGLFVSELEWGKDESFDKFTFIWKEYAALGYSTAFIEDDPTVTLFNFLKKGFYYAPADYYIRPLYVAFNHSTLNNILTRECLGRRLHTAVILQYAKDFLKTFNKDLHFSFFFMSSLTHGDITKVSLSDDIYLEFLKNVTDEKLIGNTILFFLSDHGIRFGKLRATYVGRLEERLPMCYIVFPSWFKRKYPNIIQNIKENSLKLTTPFDIYATLKDILYFKSDPPMMQNHSKRAISLFNNISVNRTCEDASILAHWCTCQEKSKMSINSSLIKKVGAYIIDSINNLTLSNRKQCLKLRLYLINEAWISSSNDHVIKYNRLLGDGNDERVKFNRNKVGRVNDITVTLIADPSDGQFEATVRYDEQTKEMRLSADISRINEYGNQSSCIQDYNLRKYCFCKGV